VLSRGGPCSFKKNFLLWLFGLIVSWHINLQQCCAAQAIWRIKTIKYKKYKSNKKTDLYIVLGSKLGLESGLESIFAGLGLGLGLGKICNQVHFQCSLCTFAVLCLGRMTLCQPVSYTHPKISVVLTVACSTACSSPENKGRHTDIYIVLFFSYCN